MRALCGSIITAGALIGLGLAALGFGMRFQGMPVKHEDGTFQGVYYGSPTLTLALVVLILGVFIGLGVAFLGLAYHHERRTRERLRELGAAPPPPVGV
jgi:NO-binding membrane sensor protein with MHYT domain